MGETLNGVIKVKVLCGKKILVGSYLAIASIYHLCFKSQCTSFLATVATSICLYILMNLCIKKVYSIAYIWVVFTHVLYYFQPTSIFF